MSHAQIFPGQGSQFPGMGKSIYDNNAKAAAMMEEANEILGFRITDVMFGEDAEALKQTEVTQPAVFIHSTVLALCSEDLQRPDMVAGHSLGEYSALVIAGALSFEDGLKLVSARASAMQRCCQSKPGTMAAIIGLPDAVVEKICSETKGFVIPANYNSDGQIVISGEAGAVADACEALKEAGAKRALPMAVSGAFHSPLMALAQDELARAIGATEFGTPHCPVYQNVNAKAELDPVTIKANLLRQLTSPVRWSQSIRAMAADGATSFLEIGPGKVLQGLLKRISGIGAELEINGIQ